MTRTIGNLENERRIFKAQAEHGETTVETAPKNNSWPPIEDIQSEFAAIKDTLTKVKLRPDLRLCDSRQGIRRSDQTTHNVCLF